MTPEDLASLAVRRKEEEPRSEEDKLREILQKRFLLQADEERLRELEAQSES